MLGGITKIVKNINNVVFISKQNNHLDTLAVKY
jgi:hypothetical protein